MEVVSEFLDLLCSLASAAFALLIKQSLPQPTSFLSFTLLTLSPIPPGEK